MPLDTTRQRLLIAKNVIGANAWLQMKWAIQMWFLVQDILVFTPGMHPVVHKPPPRPRLPPGRYTRFGYRLGHADGPWRMRDAGSQPRMLVKNEAEQHIMARIMDECDGSGRSANALAQKLRQEKVMHPRLGRPWRAGSIMMIYGTHQRHRDAGLMDMISMAMANEVAGPHEVTRDPSV